MSSVRSSLRDNYHTREQSSCILNCSCKKHNQVWIWCNCCPRWLCSLFIACKWIEIKDIIISMCIDLWPFSTRHSARMKTKLEMMIVTANLMMDMQSVWSENGGWRGLWVETHIQNWRWYHPQLLGWITPNCLNFTLNWLWVNWQSVTTFL